MVNRNFFMFIIIIDLFASLFFFPLIQCVASIWNCQSQGIPLLRESCFDERTFEMNGVYTLSMECNRYASEWNDDIASMATTQNYFFFQQFCGALSQPNRRSMLNALRTLFCCCVVFWFCHLRRSINILKCNGAMCRIYAEGEWAKERKNYPKFIDSNLNKFVVLFVWANGNGRRSESRSGHLINSH